MAGGCRCRGRRSSTSWPARRGVVAASWPGAVACASPPGSRLALTVLVCEPQPASSAALPTPAQSATGAAMSDGSSCPWYSPPVRAILAAAGRDRTRAPAVTIRPKAMSTPSDQKGRGEEQAGQRRSRARSPRTGALIALAVLATLFARAQPRRGQGRLDHRLRPRAADHRDRDLGARRDRADVRRRTALRNGSAAERRRASAACSPPSTGASTTKVRWSRSAGSSCVRPPAT